MNIETVVLKSAWVCLISLVIGLILSGSSLITLAGISLLVASISGAIAVLGFVIDGIITILR